MTKNDIYQVIVTKYNQNQIIDPFILSGITSTEKKIAELVKAKKIKKIAPKLYTSLSEDELDSQIIKSWAFIVSSLYPKALISHSTAISYQPNQENEIFLTSNRYRTIRIRKLKICFVKGPKALKSDIDFMGLKASSFERALLENLSSTKNTNFKKNKSQDVIEQILEKRLALKGENELNRIRIQAKKIGSSLKMEKEFAKINLIIGAL